MSEGQTTIAVGIWSIAKTVSAAWRFAHAMSSGHAPNATDLRHLGIDGENLPAATRVKDDLIAIAKPANYNKQSRPADRLIQRTALAR
jgi:hypothetical protein